MKRENLIRIVELEELLEKKDIEIAQLRAKLNHFRKVERQELLECLIDDDRHYEDEEHTCSYKVV
jgi:hypothetical protein